MSTDDATIDTGALYRALKEYTPQVRRDRRLPVPPALSVDLVSPECGSRLILDATLDGDRIREIGYQVRACSLGQAATAILARRAPGTSLVELQGIHRQFAALLRDGSGACDWPELEVFALAHAIPARHHAALLPFEAIEKIFTLARSESRQSPDTEIPQ